MRMVFRDGGAESEWNVRIGRPDATVGDLASALGVQGDHGGLGGLGIDGRDTAWETALSESGITAGSLVTPGRDTAPTKTDTAVTLRVVGGLAAGLSVPLAPGRYVVGRGSTADIRVDAQDVSRRHCFLDVAESGHVTVADAGSRNHTDVAGVRIVGPTPVGPDDLVSLGGQVLLRVLPPSRIGAVHHINPVREAGPGGTLPFARAPRVGDRQEQPAVSLPTAPRREGKAPFSISAMLSPMLLAAATVVVLKDWAFALISALTPLMFLGNFVEDRTRGRMSFKRDRRRYAAEITWARTALTLRHAQEARRRREAMPDPAEVAFRACAPGLRLWERRRGAEDFLRVSVGVADLPWTPPVIAESGEVPAEVVRVLTELAALPDVPVVIGVGPGEVVGLEGDRESVLAVARAMVCQAMVDSGPADVILAVFLDAARLTAWDWTKWLPHGADPRSGSSRFVAVGHDQCSALAKALSEAVPASDERGETPRKPAILAVVDGATLLEGRPCPLRDLLASDSAGGIVITDRTPALCTSVMMVRPDGIGTLRNVAKGDQVCDILVTGMPDRRARVTARALARFEDPEVRVDGAGLPDQINLLPLLDLPDVSGTAVAKRWRLRAPELRIRAVLGVTERDLFTLDLDDDGPHGLIAGTTGSGKSELLRTLIASMAIDTGPEHLTFALVDYKGGGALDECARLPHVVGLVTDLDEQLGERALRCMEAELRRREHQLRDVGLSHVREYQRLRDTERGELPAMPRLVVVIDEFATLVKALPDFVDSLVSIAQRGRSLGMHLIMATQRPTGSVNDAIKNNVKLRIALRLESAGDSNDVIDSPVAAAIGNRQWGRAYYRLSAREVLPVQTALSTGVTRGAETNAPVTVSPLWLVDAAPTDTASRPDGASDLQRLVAAARDACAVAGIGEPRRPWPDPLPSQVGLRELGAARCGLQTATPDLPALALADDPDRQTQYPVGWDPDAGNLLIYGAVGSGTTTTLAALALSLAAQSPDRCHLFVLDLGAGDLAPLADLPHTGAYIAAAERERQIRFIRMLRRELDARKGGADRPRWTVLIDNIGALLDDNDKDLTGMSLSEDLARVYADGPAVGIRFAATADRAGAVPGAWGALTQQKLLLHLADPSDYGNFDVPRRSVPGAVPGRAVIAATHQVVQVGYPGDDLGTAVRSACEAWPNAARTAPAVGILPRRVILSDLLTPAATGPEPWHIPIGIGDRDLGPAALTLYEHEHALIAGPPRSGRSSALCAIAISVLAAADPPSLLAFAPRRSPLRELGARMTVLTSETDLEAALEGLADRALVLVDDAETVSDDMSILERWLAKGGSGRHVIAAGRADGIRRMYGTWVNSVRDGRCGVLLVPDYDLDGDLLGVTLPRRDRMAPLPGRGYLVANGDVDGVQLALPDGLNPEC